MQSLCSGVFVHNDVRAGPGVVCVAPVSRTSTLRQDAAWLPAPPKGVRITNNKNVNVPLNKS